MNSTSLTSKCTAFAFILIFNFATAGSSIWRKSKITLKDGTVLTGEIKDEEWIENPKKIDFKDINGKVRTYSVKELLNFSTDRPAFYESWAVEYDGDDQRKDFLPSGSFTNSKIKDTLFLEVLVHAKTGLLTSTQPKGRKHFFIRKNNLVEELLFREYLVNGETLKYGKNEMYKRQLLGEIMNCQEIRSFIMNLQYSETPMTRIFRKINQCQNNSVETIWDGPINKKKNDLGLVLQPFVSRTDLSFVYAKMDHINWAGGIYFESFDKSKPNKYSYYNEILLKRIDQGATLSYNNYSGAKTRAPAKFEMNRLSITHSVRFSKPTRDGGRYFIGVGINWGFRYHTLVNGEANVEDAIGSNPAIYGPQNVLEYSSKKFEFGLNASMGKTFLLFKREKINIEIRYQLDPYAQNTSFYSAHNIGLGIGAKIL